ncbi:uncharacterized protein DEA37_0007665 [Paragonimus westermani]|uniref:Abasic site processing protein HMCES n=1 Tax=Paragonimus westermani TaxID=34504 RepID=A0A5J4NEP7_9TREM|nr:uncharacterized protein DEA37_0007665 [Paragonimus westermani]
MCGRTACVLDKDAICKRCSLNLTSSVGTVIPEWINFNAKHQYVPSYNIAPGSFTPILTLGTTVRCPSSKAVIQPMRWGLVPSFTRDDSAGDFATSNARIESLLVKPTYGSAMRQGKRCVVLAQGSIALLTLTCAPTTPWSPGYNFYEWKSVNGRKQPYYISPSDPKRLLMMAGVFSYHEQKQVILNTDDEVFAWLDSFNIGANQELFCSITDVWSFIFALTQAYNSLLQLAKQMKSVPLSIHPVTPRMNSTGFNEPTCIVPLDETVELKNPVKSLGSQDVLASFLKRAAKPEQEEQPVARKLVAYSSNPSETKPSLPFDCHYHACKKEPE